MHAATPPNAVGENISELRKTSELTQDALAHRAKISKSLLSKIEVGDRACTPAVATNIAQALGVTTQDLYGQPYPESNADPQHIIDLRSATRRYAHPAGDAPDPRQLLADVNRAAALRADTAYNELAQMLPTLVRQATVHAHQADDPAAWLVLVDVYSCAYTIAHRLGYPDLAELIVARQQWAATRTGTPIAEAAAAWTEAGTFQSAGDYDGGLDVVQRAITHLRQLPNDSTESIVAAGSLHLRGITLASRARDKNEAQAHMERAYQLADQLPEGDLLTHNLTFGTGNTALHELAAWVELDDPDRAVSMSTELEGNPLRGLRPTRTCHLHIDAARAYLLKGDRDGALTALMRARETAPQMARIHPMAREVLRVLVSLHRRSKPELAALARWAGVRG
ncbi:helix-turn-helix domain-containing protein [Streptomyces daliensis]|uniref:Helix-turn-helix transcriptional regulator n=1 Tax=Streptomyces daliensis TaxID=299421 RepID=A0A8T4IL71_9ACTN|nr:helix-turn-helix transcriptional regulator [Streptomyces daliensis]